MKCFKVLQSNISNSIYQLFRCNINTGAWFQITNDDNSSSSSCRAISTDIPDPISPPLPIVLRLLQVLRASSRIYTELLYVCSSWSPYLCSAMWRGPQEYITYELVPNSSKVFRMSGSSNFDSFGDGWSVAVQLLLCGVLPSWLVQYF